MTTDDNNGYTRPATEADLLALIQSLNERNVPYLLIGGFALASHGYVRATVDIDIMLPANPLSGSVARDALLLLPDHAAQDLDPEWFSEGENIRINDAFTVDLMLNANGYRYEDLLPFQEEIEWHGILIRTVSLEGLALTKKTMRAKDQEDLAVIQAAIAAKQSDSCPRP